MAGADHRPSMPWLSRRHPLNGFQALCDAGTIDLSTMHDTFLRAQSAGRGFGMAADATAISTDIVAKLTDAIENLDSIPSDEILVVLNEALDVIRELVHMLDEAQTP